MSKRFDDELGEFSGETYFLGVRADPGYNNPTDFSVTIYFRDASEQEGVEVAKIDNAHGRTHLHKLYRTKPEKEYVDVDVWGAMDRLRNKWRLYAEMYQKAHGRP